ncbi:hypothetical protein AURDEDRAFT_176738 [Auricularia subglabra TFB-10046 SS5]|uniref:Uncharacterized protein n=1 Tax=Auricularia subglabra (strain TFB-10046 / SS5) TaxID=717982 RepID=J0D5V7_AURST|nr:hypothetical protein AURDEDRAFT_176738 [Auricularia subglabra TFB-10046 SS5]
MKIRRSPRNHEPQATALYRADTPPALRARPKRVRQVLHAAQAPPVPLDRSGGGLDDGSEHPPAPASTPQAVFAPEPAPGPRAEQEEAHRPLQALPLPVSAGFPSATAAARDAKLLRTPVDVRSRALLPQAAGRRDNHAAAPAPPPAASATPTPHPPRPPAALGDLPRDGSTQGADDAPSSSGLQAIVILVQADPARSAASAPQSAQTSAPFITADNGLTLNFILGNVFVRALSPSSA